VLDRDTYNGNEVDFRSVFNLDNNSPDFLNPHVRYLFVSVYVRDVLVAFCNVCLATKG
jgi:hypothetical protein